MEASIDPKLVARSKESGKLVYFKTPQAKDAALKKGTHEDPKAKKDDTPKVDTKPNSMFGGDYAKDRGDKDDAKMANRADTAAKKRAQLVKSKNAGPYDISAGYGEELANTLKKSNRKLDNITPQLISKLKKSPAGKFVKDDEKNSIYFFFNDGTQYNLHLTKDKNLNTAATQTYRIRDPKVEKELDKVNKDARDVMDKWTMFKLYYNRHIDGVSGKEKKELEKDFKTREAEYIKNITALDNKREELMNIK